MPSRRIRPPVSARSPIDFAAVRERLGIPADYPADAVAEQTAAAAHPQVPSDDRTDIPFVTIDPPGSMDLDQAMYLERTAGGFRVFYAIADVASFVRPGGALDAETWRRGQTFYSPDLAAPLHPAELSAGAASLLPDQPRPAVLWTIDIGADGEPTSVAVGRALVRSVARLDYPGVQADLAAGRLHPSIAVLPEIGALRQQAARRRHSIALDLPDAEVVEGPDGMWTLRLRPISSMEKDNAEISLLTGICAARIMLDGKVGLLRTLPRPDQQQIGQLRRSTRLLGIDWPDGQEPGDLIAGLDAADPKVAAFLDDAVHLLRGAGYTPFNGAPPEQPFHAGVGSTYAHVTAPLRRLADRYATEVCLSLTAGSAIPAWVLGALDELPAAMATSDRRAGDLDRACRGAVSVFLLSDRVGETFAATVLQVDLARDRATVLLSEPPVRARCAAQGLTEGWVGTVRLVSVDAASSSFVVAPVDGHDGAAGAATATTVPATNGG